MRAEALLQVYLSPAIALDAAILGPPPAIGQGGPSYRLLVGCGILSTWGTWPLLAFASMGGYLARWFKATR